MKSELGIVNVDVCLVRVGNNGNVVVTEEDLREIVAAQESIRPIGWSGPLRLSVDGKAILRFVVDK